ncbi:MAG: dimethyl sulfoxide reductase anchor subunit, partial [Lewinella sp.]|nr:dimethyl sulfoxide reductase anchor subunit [Lewinella sp.]
WRAFLGLRKSWLSREIVIFGAWPPMAILVCGMLWFDFTALLPAVALACCLIGLLGVFCSVMVYADTHRDFWRIDRSLARFYGTALLAGSSISIAITAYLEPSPPGFLWGLFGLGLIAKTAIEISSLLPARHGDWSYAKKSALLQLGPLHQTLTTRWLLLVLGAAMLLLNPIAASFLILSGEWLARSLFFRAVAAPKMPGNPSSSTS